MSSLYVRQTCEAWAMTLGAIYINTINEEQDEDPDDTWFTLEYQSLATQRETFCSTSEQGLVSLVFFGKAGIGWDELLAYAEPLVDLFVSNVDPTGRLTLELSQPPSDFSAVGTPNYVVEFAVTYTFRKGV